MVSVLLRRTLFSLGILLAAVLLVGPAHPKTTDKAGGASLTGQLLVATPEVGDPRFVHAVILLVRHDKSGALGIVVNRPVDERSWASLLKAVGEKATAAEGKAAEGKVRIFAGGPMEPELGFVIHSAEYRRAATISVTGQISVTANREVLLDMARGKGPRQALVAFGYAGWGPGQLEREIALNAWFTEPADPKLVFEVARDRVWDEATVRRPISL
jgi:putative transcriptional regulator